MHLPIGNLFIVEAEALCADSIFGKEWVVPLQDGKVIICPDDSLTKSCWNPEKKWIFPETLLDR